MSAEQVNNQQKQQKTKTKETINDLPYRRFLQRHLGKPIEVLTPSGVKIKGILRYINYQHLNLIVDINQKGKLYHCILRTPEMSMIPKG